jgi:hypothetical protein
VFGSEIVISAEDGSQYRSKASGTSQAGKLKSHPCEYFYNNLETIEKAGIKLV